jgi:pantoate--beta-alanine ligase
MLQVESDDELRAALAPWRAARLRIGFVPTMGALHAGHLSLLDLARRQGAERVVASVFVNPTQFSPGEDLARYPRQLARDAELLRDAGCDALFAPAVEAIYPPGHATSVTVAGPPADGLEAAHRLGHFQGVATVVCVLLNLVAPDLAVFGEKDAQQLAVVRRMVRDLHMPVDIVAGPTVRESDGLALSSRNVYLKPAERRAATVLHRALAAAAADVAAGERRGAAVRERLRQVLASEPLARVDYAEVVDGESFEPLETLRGRVVLPLAVRIGTTRLIDNVGVVVGGPEPAR